MTRKHALLMATATLLVTALPTPAPAQDQQQARQRRGTPLGQKMAAHRFRKLTVPGEQVAENVRRLTRELHWHNTVGSALAAGRSSGKPVLWIQALGDLKGFL